MSVAVFEMPSGAIVIPPRLTSKPKTNRKTKLESKSTSEQKLRPLPAGWVRQYDIIHKRYFYVDIREKESPVSTWRFPPGTPVSSELASSVQSVDIHRYFPPASAPPPETRKATPSKDSVTAPIRKGAMQAERVHRPEPIVTLPESRDFDLTYERFLENINAGGSPVFKMAELSPRESRRLSGQTLIGEDGDEDEHKELKLPARPRRKAVPEYTMNPVQSEFLKQLSDLDLESSQAAEILLTLAFPDVIMDPSTEADFDNLEEKGSSSSSSSSSSGSSSGHSFSDSGSSAWTLDL